MDDLDKILEHARQESNEASGMDVYDVETRKELLLYKRIGSLATTVLVMGAELRETRAELEASRGALTLALQDAEAARDRVSELEEAYSVLVAINDTNRTLAMDWKQAKRAARAAEQRGMGVEWWGENSEYFANLENNIIERLLRE